MSEPRTVTPVDRGRWFAALSGPFDPVVLLDALGDLTPTEAMDVTVDLASVCDTSDSVAWLMRGTVRRHELDALAQTDALESAIQWRRAHPHDSSTDDLLAALTGTGEFTEAEISQKLGATLELAPLTRMAVALDRAGAHAPASESREAVHSAVGRADAGVRAQTMLDRGFFGREDELERAENWLSHPHTSRPVTALFINGLPGIGKSTFIDEVARRASDEILPWIVVRLDFDRGGLDVQDRVGLAMEISRQIAWELGEDAAALRSARLAAAGTGATSSPNVKGGASRARLPDELTRVLGEALRASARKVLLILDTMEVLRGRGETHPQRLFETLDELCGRGLSPLSVIAAGRGEPMDIIPERIGDRIELGGLDDKSANGLLGGFDVEPDSYPRIREVSDGIPLVLRLGALAVQESGVAALDGVTGRRELAATYLYRFLLSRIGDDTLRSLAQPGLIVRRINPDLIADVLAPQMGLKGLRATDAVTIFEALTTQHWLVEPDAVPGWVRHRSDIRKTLLENIYDAEKPATTARLNRAAARWFDGRTEPFAPFEAAYHRLQAMRSGGDPPTLSAEILFQFDEETLAELPDVARDVVHIARGDRSSKFRSVSAPAADIDHESAARELEAILERADIREAEYVFERSFGQSPPDPASAAADIVRSYLWRAGRWADALDGFDPRRYFSGRFRDCSPTTTLAQFEMWAESGFAQLARAFTSRPELAEMAADLRRRGLNGSLANGALGFALLRVGGPAERESWSMADPVASAVTVWSPTTTWQPGAPSPSVLDALAMQTSRFATHVSGGPSGVGRPESQRPSRLPDLGTPAGAARVLASATPYNSVIQAYIGLDKGSTLSDHLVRADRLVGEAGGIPPSGAGDWVAPTASTEASIDNLTALGLLAEGMTAAAFALRQTDLRLIALSAERWRRTSAGDWAYGSVAGVPTWSRRPDASIADRIAQLQTREDCLAQVRLWSGGTTDEEAMEVVKRLRGRYPAAVRKARGMPADQAAAVLLDHNVPSAFAPPLAVLSTLGGDDRGGAPRAVSPPSPSRTPLIDRREGTTMKTARERLAESEALRAAVKAQIAAGLLERMGLPDIPVPDRGLENAGPDDLDDEVVDRLESIDPGGDALEAIVQLVGRPPLLIKNNQVVFGTDEIDSLVEFPAGTDARIRSTEKFIPSVGRVEFINHHMAWGGTGWVIGAEGADRIVVTNRHVAGLVARRTADGRGVFMRDPSQIRFGASLDFNEEVGAVAAQATPFTVVDVPYLADTTAPDVAFLRITGANLPTPLPLAETDAAKDDIVALIGYPAFDDRNDKEAMAKYFRNLYNVKRYAPGRISQALGPGVALRHDCTSLGGNSGSPLIRLSDGKVVGLHFSGIYGQFNSAVRASTLRQLLDGARPVVQLVGLPLEAAGDGQHDPGQLTDRAGYDPGFLGGDDLAAPWPALPDSVEQDLARPSDELAGQPFELRYTHFGVKFSKKRRQPLMTAVNIDGRHLVAIKRGDDKWFHDGRIPREIQLSKKDYAHPDIDRGHLVRRQDPNWDDALPVGAPDDTVSELAERANADTFHYTNSAVQHGDLNSGSKQWLGLEDYILNSSKTHGFKACVFTGPVVRDDDQEIGPGVIAPREFFKLVVMESAERGRLHATAYVLSQGEMIRDLLEERVRTEAVEGFTLGAYRTFQVGIADLADVTGYDLSRYVPFDPLAAVAAVEAVDAGEPLFVPLESNDQMVL